MNRLKSKNYLIVNSCFIFLLCFSLFTHGQVYKSYTSPEVHLDKTVTFRYKAPDAKAVKLNTQILDKERLMEKDNEGIWSVTIGPAEPDIYPYHFVVDGIQVADPVNTNIFPNERFKNSLVEIPADSPRNYTIQNVPHGTLAHKYYYSDELGVRPLLVYTPPGYEIDGQKKYPVLFLLHGTTDTEETWTKVGRANIILDNLIERQEAEPMIIVMPYGRAYPKYDFESGSLRDTDNLFEFHKDFMENIVPFVEENYRIETTSKSRAIAGFSGGGGQALYIGLSHPELFEWVCGFAPGMRQVEFERNNAVAFANPELTNEKLKLFWIGCGTEDGLYGVVQEYVKVLEEKNIQHETYFTSGGHTWMNCRLYLSTIAKKLFK